MEFGYLDECPFLEFTATHYTCKLVKESPSLVMYMMNIGCGTPWNKWRKNIKKRNKSDYIKYLNSDFRKDVMQKKQVTSCVYFVCWFLSQYAYFVVM